MRWLKEKYLPRVIVHTNVENMGSIEGLLKRAEKDGLVLVQTRYLDQGGGGIDMAGEVWVPREKIAFIQRP